MRRGTDRLNRFLLALLGLLAAAAGGYLLWRGSADPGQPVVSGWLRAEARRREGLLLGVAAGVGLLAAWAGALWLRSQLPRDHRARRLELAPTEHVQELDVDAGALADAFAEDVRGLDGVADASATILRGTGLVVEVRVELVEGADLPATSAAIADHPRRRLLEALETDDADVRARFRLGRSEPPRVA